MLMPKDETSYDTVFGKMAVEQGLCTDAELGRSIEELKSRRKDTPVMLKDLMINLGYLTNTQAERPDPRIQNTRQAWCRRHGHRV
jgi:hypothetical protein